MILTTLVMTANDSTSLQTHLLANDRDNHHKLLLSTTNFFFFLHHNNPATNTLTVLTPDQ
jgi:hypothetical protein